jgi:hypothetical protein
MIAKLTIFRDFTSLQYLVLLNGLVLIVALIFRVPDCAVCEDACCLRVRMLRTVLPLCS